MAQGVRENLERGPVLAAALVGDGGEHRLAQKVGNERLVRIGEAGQGGGAGRGDGEVVAAKRVAPGAAGRWSRLAASMASSPRGPARLRRDSASARLLRTRAVITASPCASVSMPNRIPTPTATKPWSSAARTERAAQRASLRKLVRREERQKDRERWFASDAGVRTFSQNTFPRL